MTDHASQNEVEEFVRHFLALSRGQNVHHSLDMALFGLWVYSNCLVMRPYAEPSYGVWGNFEEYCKNRSVERPYMTSQEKTVHEALSIEDHVEEYEEDPRYRRLPAVGDEPFDPEEYPEYRGRMATWELLAYSAYNDPGGFDLDDGTLRSLTAMRFEALLAEVDSLDPASAAERETAHGVDYLLARLVTETGGRILDPACGTGSALAQAVRIGASEVEGRDIDVRSLTIAQMRVEVHGGRGSFVVRDALGSNPTAKSALTFDGLVLDPPLEVPLAESASAQLATRFANRGAIGTVSTDAAWLLLTEESLHGSGRAVIVLSQHSLDLSRSGNETIRTLARSGVVSAILILPATARSNSSVPTTVWVLNPSRLGSEDGILMIDTRSLSKTGRDGEDILSATSDLLNLAIRAWELEGRFDLPDSVASIVPANEIAKDNLVLSPSRSLGYDESTGLPNNDHVGRLVSGLTLENFKAFQDVRVPLRPLTLIYGPNSAGKSTLIQGLLALKQSMGQEGLVSRGANFDLGSFENLVHHHDTTTPVGLGISFWQAPAGGPDSRVRLSDVGRTMAVSFQSPVPGRTLWSSISLSVGSESLRVERSLRSPRAGSLNVRDIKGFFGGSDPVSPEMWNLLAAFIPGYAGPRERPPGPPPVVDAKWEAVAASVLKLFPQETLHMRESITLAVRGFLPTGEWSVDAFPEFAEARNPKRKLVEAIEIAAAVASAIASEADELLQRIVYIGPLRPRPQRFYSRTAETTEGSDLTSAIIQLADDPKSVGQLNDWFNRLKLPYELDVKQVHVAGADAPVDDIVALVLRDTRSGVTVSPTDVGIGISQVIPLMIDLITRRDAVICIEQPEIHLHPGLQAELADLLIETTRELGRANQVIAETHSEHLLLRLQRRIREGVLDPEQVAVLYVNYGPDGTSGVQRLRLAPDGSFLDEWPNGFFEERFDEAFQEYL